MISGTDSVRELTHCMVPCTMIILPAKQYWESLQYSSVASSYTGSQLNS